MAEEQSGDGPGDGPWLTVAAAARQLGISPRAVRGRIRRGTIEWKPQGNTGRLVRVPEGDVSPDDPGDGPEDEFDELREQVAGLREKLARAEAGLDAAATVAEARISAARAETKAVRELADRLTHELLAARLELADARRPWWRRLYR